MAFNKLLLGLALLTGTAFADALRTLDFKQSLGANAPRNYIKNAGAEKNLSGITDVSGITTRITSNPLEGFASFSMNSTSSSQVTAYEAFPIQQGLYGQSCEATFNYKGDATLYKAYVNIDNTKVSADVSLINSGTNSNPVSIIFPCGNTSQIPYIVIESLGDGAAITVDSLYLGKALGIGTVTQTSPRLFAQRGTAQAIAVATPVVIIFNQVTSPGYDNFSELNTSTGVVTSKTSGVVNIDASVTLSSAAAEVFTVSIRKNSTIVCTSFTGTYAAQSIISPCRFSVDVGDTIDATIDSTADTAYNVDNGAGTFLQISVEPSSSQTVLRSNVTDLGGILFYANAANCNWTTTSASLASFPVDSDCSAPTATGNLTAPATKIPAAVAPSLEAGRYTVTAYGGISTSGSTSGTQVCTYEIYDGTTGGGVQQISQSVSLGIGSGTAITGTFNYTAKQTNKQFEIRGRRNTGNGNCFVLGELSDLVFVIAPESQAGAKPYIPSSVFAGRSAVSKIGSATIGCSASASISRNLDGMLASIGNNSSGVCAVTFAAGFFTTAPDCYLTRNSGTNAGFIMTYAGDETISGLNVVGTTAAATGSSSWGAKIFCMGN